MFGYQYQKEEVQLITFNPAFVYSFQFFQGRSLLLKSQVPFEIIHYLMVI